MALVTCYDKNGTAHQKESIDARECCARCDFTMTPPIQPDPEIAARAQRLAEEEQDALRQAAASERERMDKLDAQRVADFNAEAARQRDEGSALAAERARLEALAKSLEQGATAADMTAAQMKEALTARGIDFKSNASKPELQALLDQKLA